MDDVGWADMDDEDEDRPKSGMGWGVHAEVAADDADERHRGEELLAAM